MQLNANVGFLEPKEVNSVSDSKSSGLGTDKGFLREIPICEIARQN